MARKLSSELQAVYNLINTLPRFCAEMVFSKMPIISSFYSAPQLTLPEATYTKFPRTNVNVFSNTKGGYEWIEDGVTSFRFKNPRTMFAIVTVQFSNRTDTDASCYIRIQKNGSEARLIRIKVPTGDEDAATISVGYEIAYNNEVTFEAYSSVAGVVLARYNIVMICAPNDSVALPEMI